MNKLIGKYCKIVTREPGESRASAIVGKIEDIESEDGFVIIDSDQGLGCININTIVAIKPSSQHKMRKKKITRDEQAAIGIGTLIVFIAMILVAAVAASVIIQTSETLQNRAYAVGKQTIREVSSGIKIVDVTGYTDENKSKIEYLALSISPRAGSYDLDLNETLVYLEYDNLTILTLDFTHGSDSIVGSVSSDGIFHTLNNSVLNSTNFGAIALRDPDNSIVNNHGIGTNDLVVIMINLSATFRDTDGLEPGQEFYGRLVPEVGSAGIFMVSAPTAFPHKVVDL